MSDYFCGISKVPKGKRLGTAEECLKSKQVRYWGIDKVPKKIDELRTKKKAPTLTLTEELFKLKSLEGKAKKLIKDIKEIKLLIEKREEKDLRPLKKHDTELKNLLKKRDTLVKQLKKQKTIIDKLEKEKKKKNKK